MQSGWRALQDVELAAVVQRRFPSLGDRLLSAVEFLHVAQDDPVAGSTALRQAVVAATTAETERLDFSAVLDRRPTARAALALGAACLLAGVCVVLDPSASQIAVARLVNPFGTAAWPQMTHLAIRRPVERVARGRAFQIEVIDAYGARLPTEVRIHYRFDAPEAEAVEEIDRLRYTAGAMTARRENVLRPFSYRVEGGDDQSMPWFDVASGRAAGRRVGDRAADPAGLYGLAARAGQAEYPRFGGHPRRDRRRGDQAAQIGHSVLGSRSPSARSTRRRRPATDGRFQRREIRLLLARSDRPRGPRRRQRRSLGDPRHPRHAADGEHRAADGESLRHAAGRGADSRGGQGRSGHPQHGLAVPPVRCRAGSHAAAVGGGRDPPPQSTFRGPGTAGGRPPRRRRSLGPRPAGIEAGSPRHLLCHGYRLSAPDRQERTAEP